MLKENYKEELAVLPSSLADPCVSVITSFNPKMISKAQLAITLKHAYQQVKEELRKNYPQEIADITLHKLQNAINGLDYTTHKKSIAIYVSPTIEKVYYLSIPVDEKITVNSTFEIRELVLNKKDKHEFLLLVISAKQEKIFVATDESLRLIVSNNIENHQRDLPERVANFSDPKHIKEVRLRNFLKNIDNGLDVILKAYPFPLFIMTTPKTMGWFKQVTKHNQYITGFIHGNFEEATESELLSELKPKLENWNHIKEKDVFNRLSAAQNDFKLSSGIQDVWKHANRRHSQLLVVEKDFTCPVFLAENGEAVFCGSDNQNKSETKDAVNDIIEKVLESGGDVEFVDKLKGYNRIALIEYYREN